MPEIKLMYDREERKKAWEQVKAGTASKELIECLQWGDDQSWLNYEHLNNFLDDCSSYAFEISKSYPAPPEAFGRMTGSMAKFWRWALWEDCMTDVPGQVERCMQTLVAAQFDIGMMTNDLMACQDCGTECRCS